MLWISNPAHLAFLCSTALHRAALLEGHSCDFIRPPERLSSYGLILIGLQKLFRVEWRIKLYHVYRLHWLELIAF